MEGIMVELGRKPETTPPVFPDEVRAAAGSLAILDSFGKDSLKWGLETGIILPGEVLIAEMSPSLRCTESCPGCPDSYELLKARIAANPSIPQREERADTSLMKQRVRELRDLGVDHVMNIGGTIDRIKNLPELIRTQLEEGLSVSWFTDGIPQIEEDGSPTDLLKENLASDWLKKVATHVSTDYPGGYKTYGDGSLLGGTMSLPPKRRRQDQFVEDPEYSRVFKSQYGPVLMKHLIDAGVRRVVANMTISSANVDQIEAIYEQTVKLQNYATHIGSPTEVLFTFSPWVWRPHQTRGDHPGDHSPTDALGYEDMPKVNRALSNILDDTYQRVADGSPRILANSSGYTSLHAERMFWREAVEQDVPYPLGRPIALSVSPTAEIDLDPMFKGPELKHVRSTFGYMDRTPDPVQNPFSDFQHGNRPYLPNIIALESRDVPEAQPIKIMDRRLARMIVQHEVVFFGENIRNKSDSPSTIANPRKLGTNPNELKYLGDRILYAIHNECDETVDTIFGLASFGLGLGAVAAVASAETDRPLKFMYIKLLAEEHKGKQRIEGIIDTRDRGVLVDDLVFHGTTTRAALEILHEYGYENMPTDLVYGIDRQLQHEGKGPSLEQDGYRMHSLITMEQIIQFMIERGGITEEQLQKTIADYRMHPRHYMPAFAR
jgi:orotate phosphoribosyltransferase